MQVSALCRIPFLLFSSLLSPNPQLSFHLSPYPSYCTNPLPKGCINLTRDEFNPKLFLGQLHRQTGFAGALILLQLLDISLTWTLLDVNLDLEKGAKALQFTVKGQELQLKTFVRDNFSHFISCKDTIDNILLLLVNSQYLPAQCLPFTNIRTHLFSDKGKWAFERGCWDSQAWANLPW